MIRSLCVVCVLVSSVAPCAAQSLMRRDGPSRKGGSSLQAALQELLGQVPADRLFAVEASVRPTFEAFPKNSMGQLPPDGIFAAIVRGFFAKEHGWILKGLEPANLAVKATEVAQAKVLVSKAPKLASELGRAAEAGRGLSLSDVVGTIAAIEHLMLDEALSVLKSAYYLNELSVEESLPNDDLDEVLRSFMMLYRSQGHLNVTDIKMHQRMQVMARQAEDYNDLVNFVKKAVDRDGSAGKKDFEEASRIARGMALRFGNYQNAECVSMKENLMAIGSKADGLVPFNTFHTEEKHHQFYQFTESIDYLKETGMLDESEDGTKQVLIANYLLGPTNCIASSAFNHICCLSECEVVLNDIERQTGAPQWPAARLAELVAQVSSSSVDAPRELPEGLAKELEVIAANHEGAVPLHSADFMHFLHRAFPNECPLPTPTESLAEESERASAQKWLTKQEECTRIPEWHAAKSEEVVVNI